MEIEFTIHNGKHDIHFERDGATVYVGQVSYNGKGQWAFVAPDHVSPEVLTFDTRDAALDAAAEIARRL